jgi:16S rRNA (cytosine967-C5)-methyltransferase
MGAARRSPMAKWKLNPKLLEKLAARQLEILCHYSSHTAPGGILVYATCSIMPEENDLVIEKFLKNNPTFEPDSLYWAFKKNGVNVAGMKENDYKLNLWPSKHGCDGFFMARIKRKHDNE